MQTPSANWLSAAQRVATNSSLSADYKPIWLLELVGVNRYFATRVVPVSSNRQLGDGMRLGSGVKLGDVAKAYELDLAEGGLGEVLTELAEQAGTVRVSGLNARLLNQENLRSSLATTILDNTVVRLRLGWAGYGPADALTVWNGVIDRLDTTPEALTLDLVDGSFTRHRDLSVAIGGQYFPGAPQASRASTIPILLGVNTDVQTIQIGGAAQGTLGYAIGTGATTVLLREYGAAFPETGTISLGSETGVTYSARRLVTSPADGKTYLELSGLVRGAPAGQVVGAAVVLTTVEYIYLIGYQISALNVVRNNGAVTTSYTQRTIAADRPVSALVFSSQQGTVTVDVNAGNVDMTNLLTNGGFETGDASGWSLGPGASVAVGTTNPLPEEGTYRAALTGALGTYGDLYQEFPTVIGEDYVVGFSYYNEDSQLLTNGGFETGDLTGWTIDPATIGARLQIVRSPIFEGAYALQIDQQIGTQNGYQAVLTYDVTVTSGATYTLSISQLTSIIDQVLLGGQGGQSALATHVQSMMHYRLGTPTSPSAYVAETALPVASILLNGQQRGVERSGGYVSTNVTFTTSSVSLRLTLIALGTGQPAPTGGGNIAPPPTYLDGVKLQLSSTLDTAQAGYQLGTPASPGAYAAVDLGASYLWFRQQVGFRATANLSRLTLRSKYTTASARATYFDHVTLQRRFTVHAGSGGQNPAEAMAYIIDTFLPNATRDTESFATAYARLIDWKFGTVLTNPGDSKALLQRMTTQCMSLLFEDANGRLKLVVRDTARSTVFGFGASNIVEGSYTALADPLDNVYTQVYVWFGAKTGGGTSPADFQASTYCTETATIHPSGQGLIGLCANALATYKRVRRLDVYADFIADLTTANLLLEALVRDRTVRHDLVTFATWLDAAPLELGDVVQIQDPRPRTMAPYLSDSPPFLAEVVGIGAIPNTLAIKVTARTLRPAGWSADFEYVPTVIEGSGWRANFDYDATMTISTGWYADFEADIGWFAPSPGLPPRRRPGQPSYGTGKP